MYRKVPLEYLIKLVCDLVWVVSYWHLHVQSGKSYLGQARCFEQASVIAQIG